MNYYPISQTYIIDPISLASQIEYEFSNYLKPYEDGIYVVGSSNPVMYSNKNYHRKDRDISGNIIYTPVIEIKDMLGDIYSADGELVLSSKRTYKLSIRPTIPVRGLEVIYAYIKEVIDDNSAWRNKEHRFTSAVSLLFNKDAYSELDTILSNILINLHSNVIYFLGQDKWIVHFVKMYGTDILIEKSCDFRIAEWNKQNNRFKKEW